MTSDLYTVGSILELSSEDGLRSDKVLIDHVYRGQSADGRPISCTFRVTPLMNDLPGSSIPSSYHSLVREPMILKVFDWRVLNEFRRWYGIPEWTLAREAVYNGFLQSEKFHEFKRFLQEPIPSSSYENSSIRDVLSALAEDQATTFGDLARFALDNPNDRKRIFESGEFPFAFAIEHEEELMRELSVGFWKRELAIYNLVAPEDILPTLFDAVFVSGAGQMTNDMAIPHTTDINPGLLLACPLGQSLATYLESPALKQKLTPKDIRDIAKSLMLALNTLTVRFLRYTEFGEDKIFIYLDHETDKYAVQLSNASTLFYVNLDIKNPKWVASKPNVFDEHVSSDFNDDSENEGIWFVSRLSEDDGATEESLNSLLVNCFIDLGHAIDALAWRVVMLSVRLTITTAYSKASVAEVIAFQRVARELMDFELKEKRRGSWHGVYHTSRLLWCERAVYDLAQTFTRGDPVDAVIRFIRLLAPYVAIHELSEIDPALPFEVAAKSFIFRPEEWTPTQKIRRFECGLPD